MPDKVIKDIRLYESDWENVAGQSLPSDLGRIYQVDKKNLAGLTQRFARKLHELGFSVPVYDHVYVNMTTFLPPGKAIVSTRRSEKWLVYVDVGVSPEELLNLSREAEYEKVTRIIVKALKALCERDNLDYDLVKKVETLVLRDKEKLEVIYQTKETSKYLITLSFQIFPPPNKSPVFIECFDKVENKKGKVKLIDLTFFDDIYPLISSVNIKKGFVEMKPRASFKAGLDANRYKVPLSISLDSVLKGN
jgi:hypothetical protein